MRGVMSHIQPSHYHSTVPTASYLFLIHDEKEIRVKTNK